MPSLAKMYFVAAVSGAALFGAYFMLMSTALYLLFRRQKTGTIIVMMILTVVMFCSSALFFILDTYSIGVGLLNPKKYPGTVVNLWGRITTAQIIIQGTNTLLSDAIVIWRAWVVWNRRSPVLIVPLVLLLGVGFSSYGIAFAQLKGPHNPMWVKAFYNFMIALSSLTLSTNIVATSLVLWPVYFAVRRVERLGGTTSVRTTSGTAPYRRLLLIIIESGGMYCLTWLVFLCFAVTHAPASHVMLSVVGQLTGIYPTLIIVLVSLNLTQDQVQGSMIDTVIKFDRSALQQSMVSRAVSFTLAQNSGALASSTGDDHCEVGVAITMEDDRGVLDIDKPLDCPSDHDRSLKENDV